MYSFTIPSGALRTCPKAPDSRCVGLANLPIWLISFASLRARTRTLLPSVIFVLLPDVQFKVPGVSFLNTPFLIGTPPLLAIIRGSFGSLGNIFKSTIFDTFVSLAAFSPIMLFRRISSSRAISSCCSFLYLQYTSYHFFGFLGL